MKNNKLSVFVKKYVVDYLKIQRNFSINTIKSYEYSILDFIKFLKSEKINVDVLEIKDLKNDHIEKYIKYLRDKNNNSSTINVKLATLRSFFGYVESKTLEIYPINSNLKNMKPLKEETKIQEYFTVEELKLIFQSVSSGKYKNIKYCCILFLIYDCGLRASELCNLKREDLILDRYNPTLIIKNSKGNKTRKVPIDSKEIINLLKIYLKEYPLELGDYLFNNNQNKPYTRQGIRYILNKYYKIAKEKSEDKSLFNIKPHPHMLRHSKAIHLVDEGVDLIVIRDLLGHSSISTTEIYARLSDKRKREILEKNAKNKQLNYKRTKKQESELEEFLKNNIISMK